MLFKGFATEAGLEVLFNLAIRYSDIFNPLYEDIYVTENSFIPFLVDIIPYSCRLFLIE